jgi:D-alanyl-D-alanine carboxypeptidase/D-alanyl-D-alanine-endopeptidase (penicillin-binding protein 4)
MRRRGQLSRLLTFALPVAGLAAVTAFTGPQAVAQAATGTTAVPAGSGDTTTPILSVRRIPGWVAETVAAQRLAVSLGPQVDQPSLGPAAQAGCLVVSQGGRILYSERPSTSLIPASNMKLLTATAILDRFGATHRTITTVTAPRPVSGVVHGDLYLVGAGDPFLRTAAYTAALGPDRTVYTSLDQLAHQVRAAGVQVIAGSVVGDESRYDQERTVPGWKPVYAAEGDVGPLSALEVNDGASPGPSRTGLSRSGPSGTSASGLQAAASANPAVRAAATFTDLLASDGVRVVGAPNTGTAPRAVPVLATIASPTLGAEVDAMLTVSDDTAAELFTKELGYQASRSGTTAAGVAAMRADLAADGLPVSQLVADDGSGLDRGDRVTCALLQADLQHLGASSVVADGLPIAGQTGTLRLRMRNTAAAGRLRAKTGTLDDVVALSGYVLPAAKPAPPGSVLGAPLVFSLIFDRAPNLTAVRSVADQIGVTLATYPQLPPLADFEPRP